MSGRKTWQENISLKSSETRAALKAIDDAFSSNIDFCYETIKGIINKSPRTAERVFPQELILAVKSNDKTKLNTLISGLSRPIDPTAKGTMASFNPINWENSGNNFQNELGLFSHSIVKYLSREELFRYQIAYMSVPKDTKSKKAFIQQAKNKMLQDTLKDIKLILKKNSLTLSPEMLALAEKMSDHIYYQSNDNQIVELRRLKQFLETDWAKGITNGSAAGSQALPIDEKMPHYQEHKDLLDQFKTQLSHYNGNIEINRAYEAIKTHFYMPKDAGEFAQFKKEKRNAFVFFENQLHHINSDGTMRTLPTDLRQAIWGITRSGNLSVNAVFVDKVTQEQKNNLLPEQLYMIYNRTTNTYRVGYKKGGHYQETPLNKLLGKDVPFDPAVVLAQKTLKKAESGASFGGYAKAVMAQFPRTGKYFSVTHRGTLNFHWGYQLAEESAIANGVLKANTIYIGHNRDGTYYYSIIAPNNEIIRHQKLKNENLTNLQGDEKKFQAAVIEEIYQNGHAYKPSMGMPTGFVSDPSTVWARSGTKVGSEELSRNRRVRGEKAYAARLAAMKDQIPGSAFSEARREALGMAALMSQGDLSLNQNIHSQNCGIAQYVTADSNNDDVDLTKDKHFQDHCLNNGVGNYMYYLHVVQKKHDDPGRVAGFYFVDTSSKTPKISKVTVPPASGLSTSMNMFGGSKPEEDSSQQFYEDIRTMLKTVQSPMHVDLPDDQWAKLGFEHREQGVLIYPDIIPLPNASPQKQDQIKKIEDFVRRDEGKIILASEKIGQNTVYTLYFLTNTNDVAAIPLEGDARVADNHKWLIDGLSQKNDSPAFLTNLNQFLEKENAHPILIREPFIAKISGSLRQAIEKRTQKQHIPVDVYDPQREKYKHIEVSNRLSYVVEQRRELWRRYQKEGLATFEQQLKDQGLTISKDLPIPPAWLKEKEVYIHPDFKLTIGHDGRHDTYTHQDALKGGLITKALEEPDIAVLNRAILAEQHDIVVLNDKDYQDLIQWNQKGQVYKSPIKLNKNVFYLHQNPQNSEWTCVGIDHDGRFFNIKSASDKIDDVLKATEAEKITLPPVLIPDTEKVPFLRNCEEVQRLFFAREDSRPSKGILSEDYLPMEKRVALMEMMIEAAKDPQSAKAQHYLRDHHMMYISDGIPEKPNNDDDGWSFYLNIKDPKNPTVHRFVKDDTTGKMVSIPMDLNNFMTTTPGKQLYQIAKRQNGEPKPGDAISLSCKDVYYNITCQSKEGFKTGTAREMKEEIYQAEVGYAKLCENILMANLALGFGLGMFFSGNVLMGAVGIAYSIPLYVQVFLLAVTSLATAFCVNAAIMKNAWLDGGLDSFEKTLDSLKLSELKEKMVSIETKLEVQGLTAELITAADDNEDDEDEDLGSQSGVGVPPPAI